MCKEQLDMVRRLAYNSMFVWLCLLAQSLPLYGHGFSADTQLHTSEGYYCLGTLAELLLQSKIVYNVDSGPVHGAATEVPITHVACGTSNCYVRFTVGPHYTDVLCCSPKQQFYLPAEKVWKEASKLVAGDELLIKFGHRKQIHSIELIQQPTELYALAVPEPHIFCIGNHGIVTHNMIIPGVMLSVSIPWGFEAGIAMMSGFLGPATLGISLAVGGAAILAYTCCAKRPKVHQYKLHFDAAALAETIFIQDRAPGKPTSKDGYKPPKNWNGEKVRHPHTGQVGYPDDRGNIWVPTGEGGLAHGGPHWDVVPVKKNGQKVDVYPGGKVR